MFEIIKAYRNLKKDMNVVLGLKDIGKITNDEELIKITNEALYMQRKLKRKLWRRKIAISYNDERVKRNLSDI